MTAPESNDKDGPVRPPVIDMEAEDVTPVAEAESVSHVIEDQPPIPPPAPKKKRHWGRWGVALLVLLAAGGGAWLYKDYGQRFWPSDQVSALVGRVATIEAANKTLNDQLMGLGSSIDALKTGAAAQSESLAAAEQRDTQFQSDIGSLTESNAAMTSRLEQADANLGELRAALDAIKQSITTAGDSLTVTPPDPAALMALTQRLDALEKEVAALKTQTIQTESGAEKLALLSQTLADLKAKFATGAPYKDELERIERLVPAASGVDTLAPHAASGLPDAQALASELAQLIPSLPAPASERETAADGDYWDYLVDLLGSVITVRVVGETNWRDVAERARAYAETNDLAAAISLIERTGGGVPAALAIWRNKAQARLNGEAALAEISAAVLRELAANETKP